MSELPSSWSKVSLADVASWGSGGTPSRKNPEYFVGSIPWLKTGELGGKFVRSTEEQISEAAVENSAAKLFPKGAVCVAMYGATIGKASILGIETTTNQACAVGVPRVGILDSEYLYYFLTSEKRSFINAGIGGAQPNISQGLIKSWPIPLPPLAEQKRIVAKIEELFSELEAGEESLRVARQQLGVYRQSLLKQAFEGHLTAQWRTQNPAKLEAWSWLTLEEVADVTGGLTKNSRRDGLPTRIPYLRVANVYANELRLDEIKDIGVTPEEAKKVRLERGDLLIVEGNGSLDQIGRVALWDGSIKNCGHQNHLIRARCRTMTSPAFVLMFLLSPRGRDLIEKQAASTSGLHTLSVSKVQRLPVPLCSLSEQQEIVRLLDEQFEVIERNEREIDGALRKSEALRQAILQKAFTGRLVPQDSSDEPASTLLTRLRADRAAQPAKTKSRTKRT